MTINPRSRKEIEVWKACDQLSSEGFQITYQAVGERLLKLGYKRGSNSDIHRYLTTWKTMKDRTQISQAPSETFFLSNTLDPISDAVEQFKREIWDAAQKEVEQLKKQLQEKTTALLQAEIRISEFEKQKPVESLINAVKALSHARDAELLKLYDHHQKQFDHYLKALSAAREENAKLNAAVKQLRNQMTFL